MPEAIGRYLSQLSVAAIILAVVGLTSVVVDAQQRVIIVNGELLSTRQLILFDRMLGGHMPDGNYWLNTRSGLWGFVGDPVPRGRIVGHRQTNPDPIETQPKSDEGAA